MGSPAESRSSPAHFPPFFLLPPSLPPALSSSLPSVLPSSLPPSLHFLEKGSHVARASPSHHPGSKNDPGFLMPLLLPPGITGIQKYAYSVRIGMKAGPHNYHVGTAPTWLHAQSCVHSKGPCGAVPRCGICPLAREPQGFSCLGLSTAGITDEGLLRTQLLMHAWLFFPQALTMVLRMSWNSQCSPGWPWCSRLTPPCAGLQVVSPPGSPDFEVQVFLQNMGCRL